MRSGHHSRNVVNVYSGYYRPWSCSTATGSVVLPVRNATVAIGRPDDSRMTAKVLSGIFGGLSASDQRFRHDCQ